MFSSAEELSQLGDSNTSGAHNSLLLTVRVGRKAFLTNSIDCRQVDSVHCLPRPIASVGYPEIGESLIRRIAQRQLLVGLHNT
jgi:hypothetical protein